MRIPVFLLSLVAASLAWGQTLPALGPDTSGQKTKRPEPSSIGPESEPPQPSDSQLPDTIISQKPLPQPAGPPALIKKQPLPKDTSAAHRALEEKNRALFDQLFGDVPKDKKIISDEMASKGTAIHNPHRSHKAIHDVVYTHIEAIKLCYSRRLEVNPDLQGEMMITFMVKWSGKVQEVEVVKTNMGDHQLMNCVVSRIKGWKFEPIPRGEGDVSVAYPIRFFP